MRTGIEQARLDLSKWDARVAEDQAALASAERYAEHLRERLAGSLKAANSLRDAVERWEAMDAARCAACGGSRPITGRHDARLLDFGRREWEYSPYSHERPKVAA